MKKLICLILLALNFTSSAGDFKINTQDTVPDCIAFFAEFPEPENAYKINFLDNSMPPSINYSYSWDFGDSTYSANQNPSHTYIKPGVFNVCLTIIDSVNFCSDTYCKSIEIPYLLPDCQADFFPLPQVNPLEVLFVDNSTGEFSNWHWDFGDGTISELQNPVHVFPQEGNYLVCLNIFDSITGCFDMTCLEIQVTGGNSCEASFIFRTDSNNIKKIYFLDMSTGNISNWLWDFGDGNFSEEQNPVHIYSDTGIYNVCLNISNPDSLNPCNDFYCTDIVIKDTLVNCYADFTYNPDSTSSVPYLVYFNNNSSYNTDQYFWDFGDGTTSTEENPVHIFPSNGEYNVCLTISVNNMGIVCLDTVCSVVNVPAYYDIGGFAFAGEYPINNPWPTGDTGYIFLYRVYNNDLIQPVDTTLFHEFGYYWFSEIIQGEYLLKLHLTKQSERFKDYFPTYSGNKIYWEEASGIDLFDSNQYQTGIHLIPKPSVVYGSAIIEGKVHWCNDFMNLGSDLLNSIEVILFDEQNNPVEYKRTDAQGYFSFDMLPPGNYKLMADLTGAHTTQASASLTINSNYAYVEIEICYETETGIDEQIFANKSQLIKTIYPNPVKNQLNIEFTEPPESELIFTLTDITGQTIIEQKQLLFASDKVRLSTHKLNPGIFLLTVKEFNGSVLELRKIIKIN